MMTLVMATIGCSTEPAPPTFEPLPTHTTPPDFVAFEDESNLFSIAYPRNWELGLSILPDLDQRSKEIIRSKVSDFPIENTGAMFLAGVATEEGFDPSVTIVVESLSEEVSVDEFAQAAENGLAELLTGLQIHSRTAAAVGGKESMILDVEYDLSSILPGVTGTYRNVVLIIVDGKIGWTVSCGGKIPQIEDYLEICDATVRSFRILQ